MKSKGFTLVEIMVVVAIIALLSSIAIPNLLRARITANEAAAKSNLQTLAQTLFLFMNTSSTGTLESSAGTALTLNWLATQTPPYVNSSFGCASPPCRVSGYDFQALTVENDKLSFTLIANPGSNSTGGHSYCVTEDAVVRQATGITGITDRATCLNAGPI